MYWATDIMSTSRRRFIGISAASAGLALLPTRGARADAPQLVTWHGMALGAVTTIQLHHPDRAFAERLIAQAAGEMHRLEAMFSLYREDSLLVRLNRQGVLEAPPAEFVQLLRTSCDYAALTNGAFDPTVQVLWDLYAAHFGQPNADPAGPDATQISAAQTLVGYTQLRISADRVAFAKPGMRVTLNGIAQGFITDRVVALFRQHGITQSLVDMGEVYAIGTHPDRTPWQAGITDPATPTRTAMVVKLRDQGLSSSAGYGFQFDAAGRFHHLFDPATGRPTGRYAGVSVTMRDATMADAFSTALSNMPVDQMQDTLRRAGGGTAYVFPHHGDAITVTA